MARHTDHFPEVEVKNDEPEKREDHLDEPFLASEDKREQGYVTACSEEVEAAQKTLVSGHKEGDGENDDQHGFFVNVPAEKERSVAAQGQGANESFECRLEEKRNERHDLVEEGEQEGELRSDGRQHQELNVAHNAPGGGQKELFVVEEGRVELENALEWDSRKRDPFVDLDKHSVKERVKCPYVWRPVRMCKAPAERKKSLEHLWNDMVVDKGPKSDGKHANNHRTQFEQIAPSHQPHDIMGKALLSVVAQVQAVSPE